MRAGFTFARLDPLTRLDEVLAINGSAEERQGQPMHPAYMDEQAVRRNLERASDVFGVTDSAGVLRAYLCLRTCGEVVCVERLLGHADSLKQGVMWVLLTGAIRELTKSRQAEGRPTWFMYDMFSGASPGMRQFKHWIGCEPYRVSWSWRGLPAGLVLARRHAESQAIADARQRAEWSRNHVEGPGDPFAEGHAHA